MLLNIFEKHFQPIFQLGRAVAVAQSDHIPKKKKKMMLVQSVCFTRQGPSLVSLIVSDFQ